MRTLAGLVPVPVIGASRLPTAATLRDPVAASMRTSSSLARRIAP